ncbi:hypothetical protein D9M69_733440 [compost metagenome]
MAVRHFTVVAVPCIENRAHSGFVRTGEVDDDIRYMVASGLEEGANAFKSLGVGCAPLCAKAARAVDDLTVFGE